MTKKEKEELKNVKKDSFVFYRSFYEAIICLDEKKQLKMFKAICDYALDCKTPKLDKLEKGLFSLIEPQLLANKKRYINGLKGGAPKGNQNARKKNAICIITTNVNDEKERELL